MDRKQGSLSELLKGFLQFKVKFNNTKVGGSHVGQVHSCALLRFTTMRLSLLWEDEWIAATLIAVRNCRRSIPVTLDQNERVVSKSRASEPFWAYYDGDEAGKREKVFIKCLQGKVCSVFAANGEPIPWRASSSREATPWRAANSIEDCAVVDSTRLASEVRRNENLRYGGQNIPGRALSMGLSEEHGNQSGENLSGCIEVLQVAKSRLWRFGHSSSLQHVLKFPLRTRTGRRPRLGDTEPLSSPIIEVGIACTETSLTLQTAIDLGERFDRLKFMSRATNLSFGAGGYSSSSLRDFDSGKQLIKAFFGETFSPPTESVLRLGNLAMMGVGMVGETVNGKIVTFVLTAVSYSGSRNSDVSVTGLLWRDSAVSSSTQVPVDTATAVILCPCQLIGQVGSRNSGICISMDFPGTESRQDIFLYWIDSKRKGVVARASWEVDEASAEVGPPVRSFTDVVGSLIVDISFVSISANAIDSCVNAREQIASALL